MSLTRRWMTAAALLGALAPVARPVPVAVASARPQAQQPLDVIYVPTPDVVVRHMLTTAKVSLGDVVYDLGSGDGRIPIAAVRDFGQTVVMVTHDPIAAAYASRVLFLADGVIVDELMSPTRDSILDAMRRIGD